MSAFRAHTPAGLPAPLARYSHAIEVPGNHRLLATSGQLATLPDGSIPEGAEAQAEQCFRQIGALLAAAGMEARHIVRLNAFVTDRAHMAGYMAARDRFVATLPPASTLVIVSGFTRPEHLVEVEALAAAP